MNITILVGTARQHNVSSRVAHAIAKAITERGVSPKIVSVAELQTEAVTVPPWGEGGADTHPTAWKEIVEQTDRFVFVLPEYNHSYPGEWKILMDSLFSEYEGKTAFVAAVGGGQFAGARVMEHVLPVLVTFQFYISPTRLHIASAGDTFLADGRIVDEDTCIRLKEFAEAVIAP